MGLLCDYFIAPDDKLAEAVIEWPGGPASGALKNGSFGEAVPGLPTVDGKGIEPVVILGMFEALLTGKSFDEQLADGQSRPMVANRDGGERLVIRIGDSFVSALAVAEPDRLRSLAEPWTQIEEFGGRADPDGAARWLEDLHNLAALAAATKQNLYCWMCT